MRLPTCHGVIAPKHHDRANDRHDHAIDVETSYALRAEQAEQKSSNNRAHDAEGDVEKEAFAAFVDNLAANKARDEAQY
jgi:hypothetical protein